MSCSVPSSHQEPIPSHALNAQSSYSIAQYLHSTVINGEGILDHFRPNNYITKVYTVILSCLFRELLFVCLGLFCFGCVHLVVHHVVVVATTTATTAITVLLLVVMHGMMLVLSGRRSRGIGRRIG